VTTQKGRGYVPAERRPEKWHGTVAFDVETGEPLSAGQSPSYSDVFGAALERLAEQDPKIVAVTAAMRSGTGLTGFAKRFPDRFFDVGISEEHAVVFAAGLAAAGWRPVFAVYSTFAQRAVDCVIHDVCLQGLPVVLCLDRAGVVGDDGPTHHGVFDLALFRAIPGLTVMQPKDEPELAAMLRAALRLGSPAIIRYPRGPGTGAPVSEPYPEVQIGKAEVLRQGGDAWIWALGDMIGPAAEAAGLLAAKGLRAGVVNARFVKPLDEAMLAAQAAGARVFATVENGAATGGFGSAVEEGLVRAGYGGRVLRFGWPDRFVPHGSVEYLRESCGLTPAAMAAAIAEACRGSP
jgi:1-deoxy-D-xylulose-5-phosphate synthase